MKNICFIIPFICLLFYTKKVYGQQQYSKASIGTVQSTENMRTKKNVYYDNTIKYIYDSSGNRTERMIPIASKTLTEGERPCEI